PGSFTSPKPSWSASTYQVGAPVRLLSASSVSPSQSSSVSAGSQISAAAGLMPASVSSQSVPSSIVPEGALQAVTRVAGSPNPSRSRSEYQGRASIALLSSIPSQSWSTPSH